MRQFLLHLAMVALMASSSACCKPEGTAVAPAVAPEPATVPATDAHMMTETPPPPPPPPPAEGETGGAND